MMKKIVLLTLVVLMMFTLAPTVFAGDDTGEATPGKAWVFVYKDHAARVNGDLLGMFSITNTRDPLDSFYEAEHLARELAFANGEEYSTDRTHPNDSWCGITTYGDDGIPDGCDISEPCTDCWEIEVKKPKPSPGSGAQ